MFNSHALGIRDQVDFDASEGFGVSAREFERRRWWFAGISLDHRREDMNLSKLVWARRTGSEMQLRDPRRPTTLIANRVDGSSERLGLRSWASPPNWMRSQGERYSPEMDKMVRRAYKLMTPARRRTMPPRCSRRRDPSSSLAASPNMTSREPQLGSLDGCTPASLPDDRRCWHSPSGR